MLIEIDGSAVDGDAAESSAAVKSRECVESLLLAHYEGKHIVWMDEVLRAKLFVEGKQLASRAMGALLDIKGRGTEIRGLRNRMKWRLKVGRGEGFDGRALMEEGKTVICAPLHHFHDISRATNGTALLGENLTDTAIYRSIGEAFLALKGWRERIAFREVPGGGGTTAQVLEALVAQKMLTLTIVDSDQGYPGCPLGRTAQKAKAVACTSLQHVHVLHVRAAENLLPSTVYEHAFLDKGVATDAVKRLMEAEKRQTTCAWRDYSQLKDGITLLDVTLMSSPPEASFWKRAAKELGRHECQEPQAKLCKQEGKERRCFVTDALGGGALSTASEWMARRTAAKDRVRVARLLGIEKCPRVIALCELIVAWGLAPARGST